jgi:hypothetical protein
MSDVAIPSPIISTAAISPSTPGDACVRGGPSYPFVPSTRGDCGASSIAITNKNLIHSCDFALALQKNMALRKYIRALAKWIRESIRALGIAISFEPTGVISNIINMLQAVAEYAQYINDEYIKPLIEFEKYVLAVLVKIRAIIQWILSLPAKILAMLSECLTQLLKSLGQIFIDEWASTAPVQLPEVGIVYFPDGAGGTYSVETFGNGAQLTTAANGDQVVTDAPSVVASADSGKSFSELAAAVKTSYNAVSDLLTSTSTAAGLAVGIAVSGTVGLIAPVSESDIAAANKRIIARLGSIPAALEVPATPDVLLNSKP